jgi:tripeptidyl-peptidase I
MSDANCVAGVVQNTQTGFGYNGESNLDLEYGMALVGPTQPVTLYQVGDLEMGKMVSLRTHYAQELICSFG